MRSILPSSKSARRPRVLTLCAVVALVSSGVGLQLARRSSAPSTAPTPHAATVTTETPRAGAEAVTTGPSAPRPTPGIRAPGSIDPASVPFDVGAVIDRVHFAFRSVEGAQALEGGHSTYSSRVDTTGLTVAPPERSASARVEPLHLSVEGVARGSSQLAGTPSDPRVAADGHAVLARGEVREMFHNRDEGVEQSWGFEREPTGDGDLVVRVRASGLAYAGETASGLHFADASTGLGFRYGHGAWVDANGIETRVEARYVSAAIELVVPGSVVARSAYPAVLDPTISPEIGMDEPVLSRAPDEQSAPRVASNGTDYLVVWVESPSDENHDVHGARVTSAGVVSDAFGIDIAVGEADQNSPDVASDGDDYFVVWHQVDADYDIRGRRITADGVISDAPGLAISTAAGSQLEPCLAWNGTEYLVAWHDYRSDAGNDIYGARVSASGTVTETSGFPISTETNDQIEASVASDGTDWFVAWTDWRTDPPSIYGTPVTAAGGVSLSSGLEIASASVAQTPAVASNGTDYLVVWADFADSDSNVRGARVSAAGTLLGASVLAISAQAEINESMPSVASLGADYLVVWQDLRNDSVWSVYGARVTSAGAVSDASGFAVATGDAAKHAPCVTSSGTNYFAVWTDELRDERDIDVIGARITSAGSVSDSAGIVVSTGTNQQFGPSVASNGTDYLVAWEDSRAGDPDVYAVRVSTDGDVLDASGISVSTATGAQTNPRVASDGADYLVVWQDRRSGTMDEVYATRVSALGTVSEAAGIAIETGHATYAPASVASNGTDYFVVWGDDRTTEIGIYGARVTSEGDVSDPSGIDIAMGRGFEPSVASNGTDYLVVWEDPRNSVATGSDIYGARVTSEGVVQDAAGIVISSATNEQRAASVASNGDDYFAVWQDARNSWMGDVYGARITSAGVVLDAAGIAVATSNSEKWSARVAGSGSGYLVAWLDYRSGTPDVYGTRVLGGVAETAAGVVLAGDSASNERAPWLARGPGLQSLLVYARYVPESPFGAERALARVIEFGELGSACGTAADCTDGFCTDGVCCNVACDGPGGPDCLACSIAAGATVDGTCGPVEAGTVCRASTGTCDAEDTCDGTATTCADVSAAGGTPCSDGLACNGAETCASGQCTPAATPTCDDSDVCTADSCADPSGCTNTPIPNCCQDADDCDDSDACTSDLCTANACSHTPVASCAMSDAGMDDDAGADDAGTSDAGTHSDAGVVPTPGGGGCAVASSTSGRHPLAWFVGLAVVGIARRMRRRRATS